jgi:ribonuclease HI
MSNLGNLVKHYRKYIQPGVEHITPFIRPPWWSTTTTVKISPASKDEAARAHQQQSSEISAQDLIIYTDGSGYNGHVGAAIYSPTIRVTRGEYIGTEDTHNVYAAELTAVQMAVALVEEKVEEYANVYIFADNQAAIQAVGSPSRQSGQYIVEDIIDAIDRVHRTKPACNIHIEWVPGHKGIEGNEKADQAAKEAAASSPTLTATRMKSAQNKLIQAMVKAQSEAEWKAGRENARHLRSMSQRPGATTCQEASLVRRCTMY